MKKNRIFYLLLVLALLLAFAITSMTGALATEDVLDIETEHTDHDENIADKELINGVHILYGTERIEVVEALSVEEWAEVIVALRAWANGSSDQMNVIDELYDRYTEKYGPDIIMNIVSADPVFCEATKTNMCAAPESTTACLHPRRGTAMATLKQGGPNATYCEWGLMETRTFCLDCAELLEVKYGEYAYTHSMIAIPPNIQLCQYCGYSNQW